MNSRAIRRHHRERLKKERTKYFSAFRTDARGQGIIVETPCRCSCAGCCNPRSKRSVCKSEHLTVQERSIQQKQLYEED